MTAPRSTKIEVVARVDSAEEMLVAGLGSGTVRRQLVDKFGISDRQAQKYISAVYARWRGENAADVPYRRETHFRRGERLFAKAIAAKSYAAAAAVYAAMSRQTTAVNPVNPRRRARLEELGPVPTDPSQALQYARSALLVELEDVQNNDALDPERRLRLMTDICGKLGMLYARSEIEEVVARVEALVRGQFGQPPVAEVVDAQSIGFAETSRDREGYLGPRPVPGPGDGPGPQDESP